jgi:hypothetical protein
LAAENLANTNKELKPIGDFEYDLGKASISMVNGTLMAKWGWDRVNESRALPSDQYERARLAIGKSDALYSDFNVPGLKCGPILLSQVLRAAPKRIEYVGGAAAPAFCSRRCGWNWGGNS